MFWIIFFWIIWEVIFRFCWFFISQVNNSFCQRGFSFWQKKLRTTYHLGFICTLCNNCTNHEYIKCSVIEILVIIKMFCTDFKTKLTIKTVLRFTRVNKTDAISQQVEAGIHQVETRLSTNNKFNSKMTLYQLKFKQ